ASAAGRAILLDMRLLLGCRQFRLLAGIEAHDYDVELLSGIERKLAQALQYAAQDQRAQARTAIIRQHEHDWPVREKVAQPHRLAGFVAEHGIERRLLIEPLIEAEIRDRQARCLRAGAGRENQCQDDRCQPHFFFSAVRAGKAPGWASKSMARSIGICTTPAARSIQP